MIMYIIPEPMYYLYKRIWGKILLLCFIYLSSYDDYITMLLLACIMFIILQNMKGNMYLYETFDDTIPISPNKRNKINTETTMVDLESFIQPKDPKQ